MNDEFEEVVTKLSTALHDQLERDLAGRWKSLTLDVRYDGVGGVLGKVRANTLDGKVVSINTESAVDLILITLDGFRKAVGPEWYGVKLTISPALECTLDFDYDSECEQDELFFDD